MDELIDEIDVVYKAISSISVSGDAVDAMAIARSRLRKIYGELKRIKSEEVTDNGNGA